MVIIFRITYSNLAIDHKSLINLIYVWLQNENHTYESDDFLFFHSLLVTGNLQNHFFLKIISHFVDKVSCEVTLSFSHYPLFQWYLQSKKISLNLSMK